MPVHFCHKEVRFIALSFNTAKYYSKYKCIISPKKLLSSERQKKNRYRSASLTTEAALVFPLFFFFVFLLWQCFLLVLFQLELCHEITETAKSYAHLGYVEQSSGKQKVDISWIYEPLMWNVIPENERVQQVFVECQAKEDGAVEITVEYQFLCETVLLPSYSLPVTQSFRFYPYLGISDTDLFSEEEEDTTGETVYVTENGTVYHTSRSCVYLSVSLQKVALWQIAEKRNAEGRAYTECTRCADMEHTEVVYISSGGTKYHWSMQCPSVKRTVIEKKLTEVSGMSACHKCRIKEEE